MDTANTPYYSAEYLEARYARIRTPKGRLLLLSALGAAKFLLIAVLLTKPQAVVASGHPLMALIDNIGPYTAAFTVLGFILSFLCNYSQDPVAASVRDVPRVGTLLLMLAGFLLASALISSYEAPAKVIKSIRSTAKSQD